MRPGHIFSFFLGLTLGVQMAAALYGFIDLRYNLKKYWFYIVRRVFIWFSICGFFTIILGTYRIGFTAGWMAYFVLCPAGFWLGRKLGRHFRIFMRKIPTGKV